LACDVIEGYAIVGLTSRKKMSWIVSFRLCLSYPLNHGHQGCQVKRKVHSQLWPNLVFARNSPRQKYEKIYISRIDEMSSNFLNLFLSFLSKTCFNVLLSWVRYTWKMFVEPIVYFKTFDLRFELSFKLSSKLPFELQFNLSVELYLSTFF